ncbi:MAG: imidazoleglycerol-phosphate dehydratase HisB [Desulfobacterales bacterium]|nr:imidazoleglycerol-phosphate dehydratase HisB [Desulfobacterales bacterium]
MERIAEVKRKTKETEINIKLNISGTGSHEISSGIPFFDHMLTLLAVHGFFDVSIFAKGDIEVDFHHTVEDVGLVLGDAFNKALGDRKGIKRYGHSVVPMDDALTSVTVDLSNRPFLVYNVSGSICSSLGSFDIHIAKEFFRAFATKSGMNLHINVLYGESEHHVIESIFKAAGKALDQATSFDERISDVCSTKGSL